MNFNDSFNTYPDKLEEVFSQGVKANKTVVAAITAAYLSLFINTLDIPNKISDLKNSISSFSPPIQSVIDISVNKTEDILGNNLDSTPSAQNHNQIIDIQNPVLYAPKINNQLNNNQNIYSYELPEITYVTDYNMQKLGEGHISYWGNHISQGADYEVRINPAEIKKVCNGVIKEELYEDAITANEVGSLKFFHFFQADTDDNNIMQMAEMAGDVSTNKSLLNEISESGLGEGFQLNKNQKDDIADTLLILLKSFGIKIRSGNKNYALTKYGAAESYYKAFGEDLNIENVISLYRTVKALKINGDPYNELETIVDNFKYYASEHEQLLRQEMEKTMDPESIIAFFDQNVLNPNSESIRANIASSGGVQGNNG